MKGSDKVDMTINIGGEILKLIVPFNDQGSVREAETAVNKYCEKLRNNWPDSSDRQILAMAAYEFARWHREQLKIHELALEMVRQDSTLIDNSLNNRGAENL